MADNDVSLSDRLIQTTENVYTDGSINDSGSDFLSFCDIPERYEQSSSDAFFSLEENGNHTNGNIADAERILSDPSSSLSELSTAGTIFASSLNLDTSTEETGNTSLSAEKIETAIVEFAASTTDSSALEYSLNVLPGDSVSGNTVIAGIKYADGETGKIKSKWKSGTVRKDTTDQGYGKLFKNVISRHIIIDNAVKNEQDYTDNGTDSIESIKEIFENLDSSMNEAEEAFDIIINELPYLTYPELLLYNRRFDLWKYDDYYSFDMTSHSWKYKFDHPQVYPEKEWERMMTFFDRMQEDLEKKLGITENICNMNSALLSTGGDSSAMESIAGKFMEIKNSYYNTVKDFIEKHEYKGASTIDTSSDCFAGNPDITGMQVSCSVRVSNPLSENDSSFLLWPCNYGDSISSYYEALIRKADTSSNSSLRQEYTDMLGSFIKARQSESKVSPDTSNGGKTWLNILQNEVIKIKKFYLKCRSEYENSYLFQTTHNDSSENMEYSMNFLSAGKYVSWPDGTDIQFNGKNYKLYTFHNRNIPADISIGNIQLTDVSTATAPIVAELLDASSPTYSASIVSSGTDETKYPDTASLKYWKRYCSLATILSIGSLATGLVIHHVPILFPCIWIPFRVIDFKGGLMTVIGIAQRGLHTDPFLLMINENYEYSGMIQQFTGNMNALTEKFNENTGNAEKAAENICLDFNDNLNRQSASLLKQNKKLENEISLMELLKVPEGENLQDMLYKAQTGLYRRMNMPRLSTMKETDENTAGNIINGLSGNINSIYEDGGNITETDLAGQIKKLKENLKN